MPAPSDPALPKREEIAKKVSKRLASNEVEEMKLRLMALAKQNGNPGLKTAYENAIFPLAPLEFMLRNNNL